MSTGVSALHAPGSENRAWRGRRERRVQRTRATEDEARRRFAGPQAGGGLTLEARLDCVWEGLRADGAAECPVCRGGLAASKRGPAARCVDCGSRLW